VFAKTLCDQRRWLCWWLLGLAAVTPVFVLPYRQVLDWGRLKATGGAGAIASDEEADALELLAHPVSRTRRLLERFGALAAAVTLLGLVVWAAAAAAADMGLRADRIAATLGLVLLALGFGTAAVAADARSGHRGATLGFTAALAVAAYLTNTVASRVDALKAAQKWSPFYYLGGDPLRTGADVGDLAVLAAIPLVMVGLALWWLNRRGVAVSAGRSA
jgi:ABC-2 type transport system permease protein